MGRFSNSFFPSETWTHPPTFKVISDFLGIFLTAKPLIAWLQHIDLEILWIYVYNVRKCV